LVIDAVYSFIGFPEVSQRDLYLHNDGYPTGAAWRFAEALRVTSEPAAFLDAFLSTQPKAEPIQSPDQAADAEYRYLVQLLPGSEPHLQVQCRRRIPGGGSWIPAAGPCRWRPSFSVSCPVIRIDAAKRLRTLEQRGLDYLDAENVFAGPTIKVPD
jgi:hypothetical protein